MPMPMPMLLCLYLLYCPFLCCSLLWWLGQIEITHGNQAPWLCLVCRLQKIKEMKREHTKNCGILINKLGKALRGGLL